MDFSESGYELLARYITTRQIIEVINELESNTHLDSAGIRNADKKFSTINTLIQSPALINLARQYLSGPAKLIRCILFDKTENTNWLVTWHQDRTICVDNKFDRDEWGPWSMKDGNYHVQPPRDILEQMITLRIHLDDCDITNGCLRVIPGTHKNGVLPQEKITFMENKAQAVDCVASRGDVLVMRSLLLHASRKSVSPSRRRIIHVEYLSEGIL